MPACRLWGFRVAAQALAELRLWISRFRDFRRFEVQKPHFISSLGKPILECLEQCVSQAGFNRGRSCERADAQVLNATEFIELEIEDQGNNNLQIEFAIGCVGDKFAPLVLNACSECLLAATRDVAPLPFEFSVCV